MGEAVVQPTNFISPRGFAFTRVDMRQEPSGRQRLQQEQQRLQQRQRHCGEDE